MGDFQLGCVLGQYDKSQSFDVASNAITGTTFANSWQRQSSANSVSFSTEVHSSGQGLQVDVFSNGSANALIQYQYNHINDIHTRLFPGVSIHQIRADFWARADKVNTALKVKLLNRGDDPFTTINCASELEHYRLEGQTYIISNPTVPSIAVITEGLTGSATIFLDDFIFQLDNIVVHPGYGMADRAKLRASNHTTLGGNRQQYTWNKTYEWSIPLSFLSNSHADQINWWWENQFILAWTLDTSDSESLYLGRIGNARQPIGARRRSDNQLFEGMLQFEAITGGRLVF